MTRNLVAKVVGIIYLTAGRNITHEDIDAWTIALERFDDGDDVVQVAAKVAAVNEFTTVATFATALIAERRYPTFTPRELAPPPSDPDVAAEWLTRLRTQRDELRSRPA